MEIKMMTSPHAVEAKVLLEKIRALRAEIPRFTTAAPQDGRTLSARTAVPDNFMESASVLVQTSARMADAVGTDATTLRDSYAYAIAYEPVVQELAALTKFVAQSIRVHRGEAAAAALDVYAIARRLSKQKNGAELLPHVEDMGRKLKKRTRKANSNPAPAPDDSSAPLPKV